MYAQFSLSAVRLAAADLWRAGGAQPLLAVDGARDDPPRHVRQCAGHGCRQVRADGTADQLVPRYHAAVRTSRAVRAHLLAAQLGADAARAGTARGRPAVRQVLPAMPRRKAAGVRAGRERVRNRAGARGRAQQRNDERRRQGRDGRIAALRRTVQ